MRRFVLASLVLSSCAFAGTITGVFQGTIVQLNSTKPAAKTRWMYVQGKNGVIRRANIAKARFDYDDDFPKAKRHKKAEESLLNAATVRVTAEQDLAKDGEWQATNVAIVSPPGAVKLKGKPSAFTPTLAKR
jgi:hypothetical protein